jgi:hypothetical protein
VKQTLPVEQVFLWVEVVTAIFIEGNMGIVEKIDESGCLG